MPRVKVLNSQVGYNLAADYYASKEKYWDSFEKGLLLPLLGDLQDKKVLDVGAGTGRLALRMTKLGAQVTALDVSDEMLKKLQIKNYPPAMPGPPGNRLTAQAGWRTGKAWRAGKLKIITGDAEDLPFKDGSFDVVVATFLIVHLKDLRRFFEEAYRVLKDGGLFLVTNINQRKAPAVKTKDGLIEIESYYHRPEAVVELLEEMAFSIEKNEFVKEGENWVNQIILASK